MRDKLVTRRLVRCRNYLGFGGNFATDLAKKTDIVYRSSVRGTVRFFTLLLFVLRLLDYQRAK